MARRTREIWRNLIVHYERSGKSREEFAAEHGIPAASFKNWIYRIKSEKEADRTYPAERVHRLSIAAAATGWTCDSDRR
jgi:hypothetical protein